jgi:glucosamine 6-phosphate synthetase-like amidotransferase/phosphosugar isomerase protein
MIAVKLGSPLLLAYNTKDEYFFSSDKQALAGYADKLVYLNDGDIVYLK